MQKIQELIAENLSIALARQKNYLFLWAPMFFALGIGLYFDFATEPPLLIGGCFALFYLGAAGLLFKHQDKTVFHKIGFLILIAFLLMALGFCAAQIRTYSAYTPMLVKKISPVTIEGIIESIEPLDKGKGNRVILRNLRIEKLSEDKTPRKARLTIRKGEGLKAGQRIKVLAGLNPPSPPVAPGAFDFQRMMYFEGIGAVGFAYNAPDVMEETAQGVWWANLRQTISHKINQQTQPPQASVLIALMTGQRAAIAEQDREALRASGLAHLLSISGLHVGMVAGVLFFFSRLLFAAFPMVALKYPIKKWAAMIALAGAAFYTVMVGATIPTQRALIMTALVMTAILFDRSPISLRLVALAAMAVLCFTPESLTGVSFQMSFAAVTALICFYDAIRPIWVVLHRQAGVIRRAILYFAGVLLTTLVAGTATGLFSLYHFQQFALYGMLANMIAVPIMAFIVMPLAVLSYLLMLVGLDGFSLSIADWGVGWILATAHWTANLEGAVWHVPTWPQWIFILMIFCVWMVLIWQGRLRRIMIAIFVLLIGLGIFYKQPDIQISSRGDLIALRTDDGSLWLSSGRAERFIADNWLRRNGQEGTIKQIWPREGVTNGFPLSCDVYGCRGEISEQKIAIAFSNRAWQEDCHWADIVISQIPVSDRKCRAPHIVDFFDLWRNGAYAIWLKPNDIIIQTVEGTRGNRPWTQTAANSQKN